MTNREKYAKSTLDETLEAFKSHPDYERLALLQWLGMDESARLDAGKPEDPLPGELGAIAGLLATGLAGKHGELPNVNVWVLVNGRPA